MTELNLQRLLRSSGLDGATALAIRTRRHLKYPNLISFKYDQRLSPMGDLTVQEARGIILDEASDWAVVSMSFEKFFNLEEHLAAPIDWDTARVEEKLDGSLMSLYWYDGAWQVQSSGTPDASGAVVQDIRNAQDRIRTSSSGLTFKDLFWQTWHALGYALPPTPNELGAPYTFAFELMTELNRVVVKHEKPRIVLHGVRNLDTLLEEDVEPLAEKLGVEAVRTFELTQANLREAARAIPATQGEGFVVRDAAFNRVKIKSDAYVKIALIRDSWSERRAAELVLLGEQSEFLAHFPEYTPQLEEIKRRIHLVTDAIDARYLEIKAIAEQKAFALEAVKLPNSAAIFALRAGKASNAYAWLLGLNDPARLRALADGGQTFAT